MLDKLENIIIVTGHYGSGKTNFAVNLALDYAARGEEVTVADMDIVNPYFRTSDFGGLFEQKGIDTIFPLYAGSNLDIPALGGRVDAALTAGSRLILDVGGDDAGATALGRYNETILGAGGYSLLYVVNFCRPLTASAEQAARVMEEVAAAAKLKVSAIVNNSNLAADTTAGLVAEKEALARELSRISGVPLLCSCVRRDIDMSASKLEDIYPVDIFVNHIWEKDGFSNR